MQQGDHSLGLKPPLRGSTSERGGRSFTRQKFAGFTSQNARHLFFLDSQGRIRIKLFIVCNSKRRCFGEIGTSAFFDPRLRVSFFFLADPGVKG